ncbi:hypothetical protein BMR08_18130 [Methylococcaceae bacterium CS2]|nr:hypothetical protein BMR08_18130 [Methylococcaceae bacterium CS2]
MYDLDGHASQLAVGALMENISIATTAEGMQASFKCRTPDADGRYSIDVILQKKAGIIAHPLLSMIKKRVTQPLKILETEL